MNEPCEYCDRSDCPWIPYEKMDYEEHDENLANEELAIILDAASLDCLQHAISWPARARELKAQLEEKLAYIKLLEWTITDMRESIRAWFPQAQPATGTPVKWEYVVPRDH